MNDVYLAVAAARAKEVDSGGNGGGVGEPQLASKAEFVAAIGPNTKPGTDLDAMYENYVRAWHQNYRPDQGGRPRRADEEPTWDDFMHNFGRHCVGWTYARLQAEFSKVHAAWAAEFGAGGDRERQEFFTAVRELRPTATPDQLAAMWQAKLRGG